MKLKKRQKSKGITWEMIIAFGVKDSQYNYSRYKNGEALDLLAETVSEDYPANRSKK